MLLATVGMPGSGKSEATKILEKKGFQKVYFGGIVLEGLRKAKLKINEKNEKLMREKLRKIHGMEAMAKLSAPKIEKLKGKDVIIDGLYSLEEYYYLKKKFPEMIVIAVYASPKTRAKRMAKRKERKLTKKELEERDRSQLENLHTGGAIALADFTIINEGSFKELKKNIDKLIKKVTKE
jgi:dephospho-CoA kinase